MYALQIDQIRDLELASIARGADVTPGEMVDQFDDWLMSEPEPVDRNTTQLFAALGVAP